MNDSYTTVELAHLAILKDAADIANGVIDRAEDPDRFVPGRFNAASRARALRLSGRGPIFRADPAASEKGGLCLTIDEGHLATLTPEEIAELHWIGREAIIDSIAKNKELFVGVILGEARQGRDYFERFAEPFQQTRLF